jgi:phosphate transport system substrate-binding protein
MQPMRRRYSGAAVPHGVEQARRPTQARALPLARVAALLAAVLGLLVLPACASLQGTSNSLSGQIVMIGSPTLQPFAQAAASYFEAANPSVKIEIHVASSQNGLDAVTARKADLAITDTYADPVVYPDPSLADHLICVVPYVIIANPAITLTSLSRDQLVGIFSSGALTNWAQLGGPRLAITPIVWPADTQADALFRRYILAGLPLHGQPVSADDPWLVRDAVAQMPGAIAYLPLPFVTSHVRVLSLDGVQATADAIASGTYSFWTFEHIYAVGATNLLVESFLGFLLGQWAQQTAGKLGYVPLETMIPGSGAAPGGPAASGSGALLPPASTPVGLAAGDVMVALAGIRRSQEGD